MEYYFQRVKMKGTLEIDSLERLSGEGMKGELRAVVKYQGPEKFDGARYTMKIREPSSIDMVVNTLEDYVNGLLIRWNIGLGKVDPEKAKKCKNLKELLYLSQLSYVEQVLSPSLLGAIAEADERDYNATKEAEYRERKRREILEKRERWYWD